MKSYIPTMCKTFLGVLMLSLFVFTNQCYAATIYAKAGMTGHTVRYVQELLIEKGYLNGHVDGRCGAQTTRAIFRFQHEYKLHVDGICGEDTFNKLKHAPVRAPKLSPKDEENFPSNIPITVEATAYSPFDHGVNNHTAMGTPLRRGVMAVDPNFIALGTKVRIPGYGEAIAEDTGGAIKGNVIDLAFDTHQEAIHFGRKQIQIFIIK